MRFRTVFLPALFVVAVLLTACEREKVSAGVEEGLPVSLKFSFTAPNFSEVKTKASDAQETEIKNLALVFFSAGSSSSKAVLVPVTKSKILKTREVSSTNYLYSISLDEEELEPTGLVSGNWYLYAIANYNTKFCEIELDDISRLNHQEFLDYCVLKTNSLTDFAETGMLMTGRYGSVASDGRSSIITLRPEQENTLEDTIHLKRLTSKVTFKLEVAEGIRFEPETYNIENLSLSSTLMERYGWTGSKGSLPGSLAYKGVEPQDDNFTSLLNLPIESDGTFSFYMMENVQVPQATPDGGWLYSSRERRAYSEDEPYGEFLYAPEKSSYVVIEGYYSGPARNSAGEDTHVVGHVSYTIHLGDYGSDFSNFSMRRNYKYDYTVKITGVNSIITEAVSANDADGKPQDPAPGAEGDIINNGGDAVVCLLDAHYETVLVAFDYNESSPVTHYSLKVQTPFAGFVDDDGSGRNTATDYSWIKFARPVSSTEVGSYPGDGRVVDVYGLLDELKENTEEHYIVDTDLGKAYTVAYIDEYFYEEKDRNLWVNADDRVMTLALGNVLVSKDQHSFYTENVMFSFNQSSIKSFYNLDVPNPFGVETTEETSLSYMAPSSSDLYAGSESMNGWKNSVDNWPVEGAWEDYVSTSGNAHYLSADPVAGNIMQTNYNYNLYQCLARNRDNNGDGIIDEDELRWYLPAVAQCTAVWFGQRAMPSSIHFTAMQYVTSTNGGYRIWWADEGTAVSSYSSAGANSSVRPVRCVRNLGLNETVTALKGDVSTVFDYDEESRVVTITGLKSASVRSSGSQHGEYAEHTNSDLADVLPEAFQIAKKNLKGVPEDHTVTSSGTAVTDSTFYFYEFFDGTFCEDYYSENEDQSDLGEWRIPNEKELYLLYKVCFSELVDATGNNQIVGAKTKYDRKTSFYGTDGNLYTYFNYYGRYDGVTNDPIISTGHSMSTTPMVIRCVRDAEPRTLNSDSSYDYGGSGFGL